MTLRPWPAQVFGADLNFPDRFCALHFRLAPVAFPVLGGGRLDRQFGPFQLNSRERQVTGPEGALDLSARSFDILSLLLDRPDEVIGKARLMEGVWPGLVVEDNTLQVHVSALRKALPEGMIVTVHGRGYKYAGPKPEPLQSVPTTPKGEPGARPSIAVLPFDNLSGDPEQDYFSDGITEDIMAELGNFREFLVMGRNSSFRFRARDRDPAEVARTLGVQYLVEGSVRKAGNRVRVTVQLTDAASLSQVWAERYDRDLTDIFAIQDEITQMIAARLARQARLAVTARSRSRPTDSLSAYDLYLRALQTTGFYDAMFEAEPYLRQAIALDPGFAAAQAILGLVQVIRFFWDEDPATVEAGLDLGRRAISLDPEEPYGHLTAGAALLYSRKFKEAEPHLDRALALNPNDPLIRTVRALLFNCTLRSDLALAEMDEARRRDPFAVGWFNDFLGIVLAVAGHYGEAVALAETMANPTPWFLIHLTICHAALGDRTQARATLTRFLAAKPGRTLDEAVDGEDVFDDPAVLNRYRAVIRDLLSGPQ
jgi:TolB-like protein